MTDSGLVRVWLGSYEQIVPVPRDAESVRMLVGGPNTGRTAAVLRRVAEASPRAPGPGAHAPPPVDEHMVAGPDETDPRWLSAADVIVVRADLDHDGPDPAAVLGRFPGCLVMALAGLGPGSVVQTRSRWRIRFVPRRDSAVSWYASFVHAWLVTGRPLAALNHAYAITWDGALSRRVVRIRVVRLRTESRAGRRVGA